MARKRVKKITKASKRRLFFLGTLSAILFLIFCYNVYSYSSKIISLSQQEKELTRKLSNLKDEKEDLAVEIDKLHDPNYLANFARENYLYSKDGEYVLKIDDTQKAIDDVEDTSSRYKIAVGSSLAILGLIVFVIFKRR